jgi:hypothetical protein
VRLVVSASSENLPFSARVKALSASIPIPWVLLVLIVTYFTLFYARIIYQLPIYGDAAEHARIARELLRGHILSTGSPYPPLYHSLGALGLAVAGEDGFKTVTVLSLLLLGPAVFLLARELCESSAVALTSALIAYISPKTPFYAGRLYMEILLTVLIIFAFFFLVRYARNEGKLNLVLCAIFSGLAAITKQQGLVLVVLPAFAYFLGREFVLWLMFRMRPSFHSVQVFLPIVLIIVTPSLVWQMKTSGAILPETEFTSWMNNLARDVTGMSARSEEAWQLKWDSYLTERFEEDGYAQRGFVTAESHHIWPQDVFTSPGAFFSVNSPYWRDVAHLSPKFPWAETTILCALFASGVLLFVSSKEARPALIPLAGFLVLNYAAFVKNTDQLRYHVFIPYMLAFLIPYAVYRFAGANHIARMVSVVCMALILLSYSARYLEAWNDANLRNWDRQAYTLSRGGMHSVMEASSFIKEHSDAKDKIFTIPAPEFGFYADREAIYDYRLLFLEPEQLSEIFRDMQVAYIVIPDSQVVQDASWNHVGRVPASFVSKIASLYSVAYLTQVRDVAVYQVSQ